MSPAQQTLLVTLIAYHVILVGLGLWGQRRTRDGVDFFLGGRRLGPTVAAVSAAASSSSAWTLLSVSGAAYAWGLAALWIFPACVGGFVLNWTLLAPGLRRLSHETGALTATEVLAGPAGTPLRGAVSTAASAIVLASLGAYVASQFMGAGKAFNETFGLPGTASILLGSGIVVLYTLLGGFWAVSLTDTLQGLVMAAAAIVVPVGAVSALGGPAALVDGLRHLPVEGYLDPWRQAPLAGGLGFVLGLLGIGLGYPGQPHVVNRFMALQPGARAMRRARRLAIGWAVIIYAGMLVTGLAGRLLVERLADKEKVLLALTTDLFPPVVAGLIVAAVLSAIMSTADSQLLVAGAAVTHDMRIGGGSPATMLRRSRFVVLGLSAGAVGAALTITEDIYTWVLFAWSAMGCAFGPLLLVTVLRGPVPPGRTLAAMLAGFALSVLAYLGPHLPANLPTRGGVFDRVIPFVVALGIALLPGRRR